MLDDQEKHATLMKYSTVIFFIIKLIATIPSVKAQEFRFFGEQVLGNGDATVEINIINPPETTGDRYRVFFVAAAETLFFAIENLTTQSLLFENLPSGSITTEFDGITVTARAVGPQLKELLEVQFGDDKVEPPVHIFRPGDRNGRGGANSTGEYTFVGGGGDGRFNRIARNEANAAPFDYEIRFDGNPFERNKFIHALTQQGTFDVPFSVWNIGIDTPDDSTDDRQIIAIGFDDSQNPPVYDGGATPSDSGPGTMYDRIYIYDLNIEAVPDGDINFDGVINYDDLLLDISKSGGDVSNVIFSRAYLGNEVLARFSMVGLNDDPNYIPSPGTTIRIKTTKPPTSEDVFEFATPRFGLYTDLASLDFGSVRVTEQLTFSVTIFNNTAVEIAINNISSDSEDFFASETNLTLASGDSATVQITFAPLTDGSSEAVLTIESSDIFFPNYQIPLTGEGLPESTGAISILGHLEIPGDGVTDIWGYFDQSSGIEYALLGGARGGFSIVDVSNPGMPELVAQVTDVPGFDVKSWKNYVYTVNGGSSGLGGIVDISDPGNPQTVGTFPSSHNIFITNDGYMILEVLGIRIFDLNPDPTQPRLVWSGGSEGHDASVIGNFLYDFHGTAGTFIYDFSERTNPVLLSGITDPTITYHHSGWTSKDGNYLFICDELANHPTPDITVWDISEISNPSRVGGFGDSTATVHNLFVIGDLALTSYYTAGFQVLDVSDPTQPKLFDQFDTSPDIYGEAFGGAWGVYPFSPSRNIYVSDRQNGLYIFAPLDTISITPPPTEFALLDNYPNPFIGETIISFEIPQSAQVRLSIYNILGQRIRTLLNAKMPAGRHDVAWNGTDVNAKIVASGIFFYQIETEQFVEAKQMLFLK